MANNGVSSFLSQFPSFKVPTHSQARPDHDPISQSRRRGRNQRRRPNTPFGVGRPANLGNAEPNRGYPQLLLASVVLKSTFVVDINAARRRYHRRPDPASLAAHRRKRRYLAGSQPPPAPPLDDESNSAGLVLCRRRIRPDEKTRLLSGRKPDSPGVWEKS